MTPFRSKNVTSHHFIVTISNSSTVKNLYAIKYLLYRSVKWEKIHRDGPIMCYRCQRTDHTAGNCNMDFRCVKCSEPHLPGECKIKSGESSKENLYCVRCKKNGHPASYRGCPVLQEHLTKIRERINKNRQKQTQQHIPSKSVNPDQTFASFLKTATIQSSEQQSVPQVQPEVMEMLRTMQQTIAQKMAMFQAMIENQAKQIADLYNMIMTPP